MASEMKNPSVVLYGKKDIRLVDLPIPVPKDDEVLITVHTVGICGSDSYMYEHGELATMIMARPFILGHEASGVVVKCGSNVTNLKEGDSICMEITISCNKCELCTRGNYNVCKEATLAGVITRDGFLSRYAVHPAAYCFKLPDTMDIEYGAFVEPLSVGAYACERAGVSVNSKVLVIGAGPVGLSAAMVAKSIGAEVCITEILKNRLDVAGKVGVEHTILCDTSDNEAMRDRAIAKFGRMPEITIECSGSEDGITLACLVTESAGVVSMVGLGHENPVLPLDDVIMRGIDLRGVSKYKHSFQQAIRLISLGRIDVEAVISHRFPIEKALDAFKLVFAKTGEALKVHIQY